MSDDSQSSAPQSASEIPDEMVRERETFVRSFLKKGVEYADELLKENEELRRELHVQKQTTARLRSQVASDDAIRDLIRTVERLEVERKALLERSSELEENRLEHEVQQKEIEQQVNDLANLYVATYQLHATLSLKRVVRGLEDMVGQLVGAEEYAIYIVAPGTGRAEVLTSDGTKEVFDSVTIGEGHVGEALLTGISRIREGHGPEFRNGAQSDPVAVVPLMVEGRAVGAVEVRKMLEQKDTWASVDREMFELLGAHAGTALIGTTLYHDVDGGPAAALSNVTEYLMEQRKRESLHV